ncbi:MFS transporter [Streptomyces acidiscabies]|uniref:MFS transporter n=1 Tax=Streptomyces acidiscabies TaxID=42234 RepID=UPI002FF3E1CE
MLQESLVPTPAKTSPSLRLRWAFVGLLVVGGVVNYLDRATLSVANTTISGEFGLSSTEMGLLLAAFSWPYAIANLPAGYLVDKFGPKKMYAWAAGLWSLMTMVTAAASSFGLLYAARVALGVAESPFFTASLKVNERWFGKEERALPISVVNTGSQIANAIAPPLLTSLLIAFGWRGMFLVVGALGIFVMLVWLRVYRDPSLREQALIRGRSSPKKSRAGRRRPAGVRCSGSGTRGS